MNDEVISTPTSPPEIEDARRHFQSQGFMHGLGANLTRFERGRSTVELPWRDDLGQQHGYFHGGVIGAVADTAAGFAVYSHAGPGRDVLTVEYKINFLAPAQGSRLSARGEVLRHGGTLGVAQSQVFAIADGAEALVAVLVTTLRFVRRHGND